MNTLSETYYKDRKKKPVIDEFIKILEIENSKIKKKTAKQRRVEKERKEKIAKEAEEKVAKIRKKKSEEKKKQKIEEEKQKVLPKVGDRVRMTDGKSVGRVESIEKGKVMINYGLFTTSADVEMVEVIPKGFRVRGS